jgi:hypothetical protein
MQAFCHTQNGHLDAVFAGCLFLLRKFRAMWHPSNLIFFFKTRDFISLYEVNATEIPQMILYITLLAPLSSGYDNKRVTYMYLNPIYISLYRVIIASVM